MNHHAFTLGGAALAALPSGALWWPEVDLLAVSDLHLAKSERVARRSGAMLPPYDSRATLARLRAEVSRLAPRTVICLGDSFDDLAAAGSLRPDERTDLAALQEGRDWVWIEGNHDPGASSHGGRHLRELRVGPLVFRHIAEDGAAGEVSGHYHPKARLALRGRAINRPCFLYDAARVVLPAYGTYTGGLDWCAPPLRRLFPGAACAVLTGTHARAVPVPAGERAASR
ncbi:ligase-associated DNA damage response endonuclease PdeM [Roseitranquillus sediminis]|uniref:ligase-associated DNA damage response endonuclease PdeM n=1 Tax=Roseitranquillus sediminis TaxID=2809051 RepID=UPI001D0C0E1E|nr:ligase-associated DNA damage response endonuclease PdeM [Roseitranquillus sediminis]MBM9596427.1 ligase-associated DNA damage response endonuclease PdeM [Roseitranquillus sediminis]